MVNVSIPGKLLQVKFVIGTKSNELDNTAGCPTDKAESIPIFTYDLGNVW